MGSPKQVLQFRGTSLLRRTVLVALGAGCGPVIVVTGAYAELSRCELDGLDVQEVLNTDWETGMASSVSVGIEELEIVGGEVDAAVLNAQERVTAVSKKLLLDRRRHALQLTDSRSRSTTRVADNWRHLVNHVNPVSPVKITFVAFARKVTSQN